MTLESEIKFVELENFYENLNNPIAAELFAGMLEMRKSGYESFYSQKFLPFDESDLIATHYLVCLSEKTKLVPIAGYKRVSLKTCDDYQVTFPITNWMEYNRNNAHLQALEGIINEHYSSNRNLTYGGHIVLHKRAKEFITSEFLRQFAAGATYLFYLENGNYTELVTSILRTRTNLWFEQVGYKPLCWKGAFLAPTPHPKSPEDSFVVMEMRKPSNWANQCYEMHKPFFEKRILIKP